MIYFLIKSGLEFFRSQQLQMKINLISGHRYPERVIVSRSLSLTSLFGLASQLEI